MLTLENAGLRYVKEVVVSADRTHSGNPQPTHQWLDVLINQIAKDTLSRFHWETPHSLPCRLLKLLWHRQQKLLYLEVFAPYIQDSWNRDQELSEVDLLAELNRIEFPSLTGVRAVPDSPETALLACAALKRENVTCLEVDGRLWHNGDARVVEDEDEDDSDATKVEDQLTEYLFSHVKPVAAGRIPNCGTLTNLTRKDINVTLCKHTWFAYLEMSQLKHLRLEHCTGADIFLMRIAAGAATPALHSFVMIHDLGRRPDRTIHAIEDLLSSPRNKVQRLELALRNAQQLPSSASIRAHSRSLRTLLLDVENKETTEVHHFDGWAQAPGSPRSSENTRALVYEAADFQSIIQSCSSLVELGIAFPDVGLEYKELSVQYPTFQQRIDVLASNLNLTTLNVLNWPANYKYRQPEGYYAAKNLQLARLASDIFRRPRCFDRRAGQFVKTERHPILEVVAFGVREKGAISPSPAYFVQSELSVLGKRVTNASGVDLQYLRDQRLDIQILDYEERDFDETSRKNFGASHGWDTASNDGHGGWGTKQVMELARWKCVRRSWSRSRRRRLCGQNDTKTRESTVVLFDMRALALQQNWYHR